MGLNKTSQPQLRVVRQVGIKTRTMTRVKKMRKMGMTQDKKGGIGGVRGSAVCTMLIYNC